MKLTRINLLEIKCASIKDGTTLNLGFVYLLDHQKMSSETLREPTQS